MTTHFADRLLGAVRRRRSALIVGIDPVLERLPPELSGRAHDLRSAVEALERFSQAVVDQVAGLVAAVKLNAAFFEAFYEQGLGAYYRVVEYAHAAGLLVIGDVKRGDIGSTAAAYVRGHLARPAWAGVPEQRVPDAVTVSGVLGAGSVRPWIETAAAEGKGVFVLVRPSDPGADEVHGYGGARPLYEHLAELTARWAEAAGVGESGYSCVGAVVAPKDGAGSARLREILRRCILLLPGYGAQGLTVEDCRPCFCADGGAVVNASRSVIYAYEDAQRLARAGGDWRACIAQACGEHIEQLRSCWDPR